ncbi:biotin-dependent carboxyltransferase family protein [Octadecabacter sp. G9-8]|uniref:Biotin-dependent carboxyltransferase family protein n=1 Tax=Octadecabacter dasysiphoniae TaxID=2909341 RepID=A0ABS9D077_9RHOB|nr:biotin-dependent carboxyltransferase family protein [Octadecabacter dasysiphoniae]MCF2872010.1 biotin-dependent carboxyltransferase family protein [Octadecabacter dasysiphoniae]
MADAVFSVSFAGPLVTVQDAGRPGNMRYGVSASGPMDRLAYDAANAALGNPQGSTAIEISLGGLMLQCKEGAVTLAITGGDFVVEHGTQKTSSWTVLTISKGERIAIRAGRAGSWAYLAFAGCVVSKDWLQSQATHSTSGFGGGAVQAGHSLTISDATICDDRLGEIVQPDFTSDGPIRIVTGPQDHHFSEGATERLVTETYQVTDAYDRMGMRLSGPLLELDGALSIPSEPIVRGSIQVSGDGVPTVLLADHQTTGGYPKIATVISCDTDRLAQFRAGQSLRFTSISSPQAIDDVRTFLTQKTQYLRDISVPRGSLAQRLMRENLIHGCVFD